MCVCIRTCLDLNWWHIRRVKRFTVSSYWIAAFLFSFSFVRLWIIVVVRYLKRLNHTPPSTCTYTHYTGCVCVCVLLHVHIVLPFRQSHRYVYVSRVDGVCVYAHGKFKYAFSLSFMNLCVRECVDIELFCFHKFDLISRVNTRFSSPPCPDQAKYILFTLHFLFGELSSSVCSIQM